MADGQHRLDSWKEIADYLGRDVRTVIRWGKEKGLPVRRLPGGRRNAVFAYAHEIDAWMTGAAAGFKAPAPTDRNGHAAASLPAPSALSNASRHTVLWATALAAVAVLSVFLVMSLRSRPVHSIAVLPFTVSAAHPEAEYVAEGLTEGIINRLSRSRRLRVLSRTSVFNFKGQQLDPAAIGERLGTASVLLGRVEFAGEVLTITLEMVDTRNRTQLWGASFKRKLAELPIFEQEVADTICAEFYGQSCGPARQAEATTNPEALRNYLRARHHGNKLTPESVRRSIQYFQLAIEQDPTFALAHAGLAEAYAVEIYRGGASPRVNYPLVEQEASKALRLDPNLAQAHNALATFYEEFDWDWIAAEQSYKKAVALNPNNTVGLHWYSHYLSRMGRHNEAIAMAQTAVDRDPLSLPINGNLAAAYFFAGDYDRAILQCHKTLEIDPLFPDAHSVLAVAYRQKGMHQQSIAEFQKAPALLDDVYGLGYLGHAYAVAGQTAEARSILQKLAARRDHASPYALAVVHLGLQENQQALDLLEKAGGERDPYIRYLKVDPIFAPLHSDARFHSLLSNLQLARN